MKIETIYLQSFKRNYHAEGFKWALFVEAVTLLSLTLIGLSGIPTNLN